MALTKPLLGKHYLVKLIYGLAGAAPTPYTFRCQSFKEDDGAELRSRSHLGRRTEDQERIQKNYSGSITALEDGPTLDLIAADIDARDKANLPPSDLSISVTKLYRDGTTAPGVLTWKGCAIKVSASAGSRTDDVTRELTWQAEDRILA